MKKRFEDIRCKSQKDIQLATYAPIVAGGFVPSLGKEHSYQAKLVE